MATEIEFAPPPRPSLTVTLRPRPQAHEQPADPDVDSLHVAVDAASVKSVTGLPDAIDKPQRSTAERIGDVATNLAAMQHLLEAKAAELAAARRVVENAPMMLGGCKPAPVAVPNLGVKKAPVWELLAVEPLIEGPVRFVANIPTDDRRAWAGLGVADTVTATRLGKRREGNRAERDYIATLLARVEADVTVGTQHHQANGLAAWALVSAAESPQAFARMLRHHGHEPKLMFDLVHIAPQMFTLDAILSLLPARVHALADAQGSRREVTDGLWHTGCRMLEGFVKNLVENPPVTIADERLNVPSLGAKRFPTRYIAAVNTFERAERAMLQRFADDTFARRLVGEWFSAAAKRRFSAPALKRSRAEGKFLEHLCDVTQHLQPKGGFTRYWDRAYVLRESRTLRAAKHAGGFMLRNAGSLLSAMFAGANGYHGGVGYYPGAEVGYAPPMRRRSPSPVRTTKAVVLPVHRRRAASPAARRVHKTPAASPPRRPMEDAHGAGPANYAPERN